VCAFSQENEEKSKSVGKTREKKNSPMDSRFSHGCVQPSFAAIMNSRGAGSSEWWTTSEY